jgi:hypothetical protein
MQVFLSPIMRLQILWVMMLVFGHERLYISEASRTSLTTAGSVPSLNLNKTMCTIGILKIQLKRIL